MIASWMLYAALVGALFVICADALERVAAVRHWPRRFLWVGAIAASILWPAASLLRRLLPSLAAPVLPFAVTVPPLRVVPGGGTLSASTDRIAIVLWVIATAALLARLAVGILALRHARHGWAPREVDGTSVRLSMDVGPAVVGLRAMDVVLPEWVLSLDDQLRAIVLRHEEEHRVAHDPVLLFSAALGVALLPWSPALWYAARRLRLAIELDCDARVLRRYPSAERYGLLMLAIAQRRTSAPALFAATTLFESNSQLERRILAMRPSPRRLVGVAVLGAALVATAALALACSLQSDKPTAPAQQTTLASKLAANKKAFFEFKLTKEAMPLPTSAAPRYPDALRRAKVEGDVVAMFVVNPDGRVDEKTFKVVRSSNDLFTQAVKSALLTMRFSPAEVDGRKVRQLVTMPFKFALKR